MKNKTTYVKSILHPTNINVILFGRIKGYKKFLEKE